MSNLEKKNIIVTGASGGIGNAIIKKLSNKKIVIEIKKYRQDAEKATKAAKRPVLDNVIKFTKTKTAKYLYF